MSHKNASIDLTITYDSADAGFLALQAAFEGKTDIGMAFMDGPIATNGSKGLQADFKVSSFKRNEPVGDKVTYSASLKLSADSTFTPVFVTISS